MATLGQMHQRSKLLVAIKIGEFSMPRRNLPKYQSRKVYKRNQCTTSLPGVYKKAGLARSIWKYKVSSEVAIEGKLTQPAVYS